MKLVQTRSLAATLDAANAVFFTRQSLRESDRRAAAKWIAARQGLPGSYAGMFAPTEADFCDGIRVFTGERIGTRAGTAHILGEEACRALILLNVKNPQVQQALANATAGMLGRLPGERRIGMYCCGICSVSLWRHLAAGGLDRSEERLVAGIKILKTRRIGDGRWQPFPFWYTLLALHELDHPAALEELRYAAPSCDRFLQRSPRQDRYARRRRILAERVLAKCS